MCDTGSQDILVYSASPYSNGTFSGGLRGTPALWISTDIALLWAINHLSLKMSELMMRISLPVRILPRFLLLLPRQRLRLVTM